MDHRAAQNATVSFGGAFFWNPIETTKKGQQLQKKTDPATTNPQEVILSTKRW